ncbi:DnaB-like helicase C-terminal domain-containing protein [Streptomyces sp. NPDC014685]|uniref:DnaB-like helicase C-terminal domain-containing protein n=1 Tax=Streptomyces sp. NPDC014685 TaxID=3364881 RepID=UPI0036FC8BE0
MVRKHARKSDARRARALETTHRQALARSNSKRRIPTSLTGLDALLLGGLRPGRLTVVAARTAMGKSKLALAMARNCAIREERPALIASLEMGRRELWERLMAAESGVPGELIGYRTCSEDHLQKLRATALELDRRQAPLDLGGDGSVPTVDDIAAECERAYRRYGRLDLVVVDYLGLMRSASHVGSRLTDRHAEIAGIVLALQDVASRFRVAVVVVEQLTRAVAERDDHRPRLEDMWHAEQLLGCAEAVILLHRDEYYTDRGHHAVYGRSPDPQLYPEHWFPRRGLPEPVVQQAELHVAFHRHGPTGVVPVGVDLSRSRFFDLPTATVSVS